MAPRLDAAIQAHGQGRAGQVHLTLSRAGLTNAFNHYPKYGSDFDQQVALDLLGTQGKELLARDGEPQVIQVAVPGAFALEAAHPFFGIDNKRGKGEVPNLADEFLKSWSFRLAYPSFQSRTLKVDSGMIFFQAFPVAWIKGFYALSDLCNQEMSLIDCT